MWSCYIFQLYIREFSLTSKRILCNNITNEKAQNDSNPKLFFTFISLDFNVLFIACLNSSIYGYICMFFCNRIFKNLTWILPATPRSLRIKNQSKTKANHVLLPRKMLMPGYSVSITAANLVFISSNIWWIQRLRQKRSCQAHRLKPKAIFRMWPWKKEITGPSIFLTLLGSPHLLWRVKERRVHCRCTCRSLSLEMVSMTVKESRVFLTDRIVDREETPPPAMTGTWSLGRSRIC